MMRDTSIRFQISCLGLELAVNQLNDAMKRFTKLFEDRDSHFATNEGQWPDKFVVLNRFVRTGRRPPFIFND